MKKVILSLVMLLMATSMFAQEKDVPNPAKVRVPSGYQGFIEQGNTWHFDKNMPNSISLSTTHGFYFNGHIYAGIGLGVDFNNDRALVPFYTNLRYQFNNTRVVSPIISLRLGSYVALMSATVWAPMATSLLACVSPPSATLPSALWWLVPITTRSMRVIMMDIIIPKKPDKSVLLAFLCASASSGNSDLLT